MFHFHPKYLGRYRDLALLMIKHKQRDLVHKLGLDKLFDSSENLAAGAEAVDAREIVNDLEKLGPTFIKLGQLFSTRTDMLPEEYLEALTRLQDNVAAMPFTEVEKILREELGTDLQTIFEHIDKKPLASASIGQVHRATLNNNDMVVIKVQRPGVREEIFADLEVLGQLAHLLDSYTELGHRYRFSQMLTALRRSLLKEVDYSIEADNAVRLKKNLKDFALVRVPQPYLDYSTDKVLTLEFIDGTKIDELATGRMPTIEREKLARELFRCYMHQAFIDGFFHADPHPGNVLLTVDGKVALLDCGMMVSISSAVQDALVKMMLALNEANGDEVCSIAVAMGNPESGFDKGRFRERIRELIVEYSNATMGRMQTGRVILELQAIAGQCNLRLPSELVMLGKTLMNLDRVIKIFAPALIPSEEMRNYSTTVMQHRSQSFMSLDSLFRAAMEAGELTRALPYRLNKFSELLADNEMHLRVHAFNEKKFMTCLEKIANRVTVGIILGALIVGASLIMRLDSTFYTVIAFFFYLVASAGGAYLVLQSFFRDEW